MKFLMNRSKKIFLVLAAIFMLIMILIGWDMSRKTTFPGSPPGSGSEFQKEEQTKSE